MPADLAVPSPLRLIRASAGLSPRGLDLRDRDVDLHWELDLLPAAITIGDSANGRPAVAMVAAGELVLHADVVAQAPSEPAAIAALLLEALSRACEATGRKPVSLLVRHDGVAAAIRAGLPLPKPVVTVARALPAVDNAMEQLERTVFGVPPNRGVPRVSRPSTWAAWGAPSHLIAALFATAADFFRLAPWTVLANDDVLTVTTPTGRTWSVVVMGQAAEVYGLALYESADDLHALFDRDDDSAERAFQSTRGAVISFLFEHRDDLPPQMVREVRTNGWLVAGPGAYPTVIPMHTPGGGLSEADLADLVLILDVVPRFVAAHPDPYLEHAQTRVELGWTDEESKATVVYDGPWGDDPGGVWVPIAALQPCTACGPGSHPEALYPVGADLDAAAQAQFEIVTAFEVWLQRPGAPGRVSAPTARKHARLAEQFTQFMVYACGSPLAAINELDLRVFVYESYPLHGGAAPAQARAMLNSLERFFVYLDEVKGIESPWRDEVIDDREAFFLRWDSCPEDLAPDTEVLEWMVELMIDLDGRVLMPPPEVIGAPELEPSFDSPPVVDDDKIKRITRRWLLGRDEVIRAGVRDPTEVRERTLERWNSG